MSSDVSAQSTNVESVNLGQTLKMLATLFKMRIVSLLLFAALGGAFLGANGIPNITPLLILLLTGTLAAGGASAINQYLEQNNDAKMRRTDKRPLINGQVSNARIVLAAAALMIIIGAAIALPINPVMSFYLTLGALIYIGIYTVWLKPRSILNIVIGGAAGSCAVMSGGAAVNAASDPGVISLALLVFLWTPAHFWALAMFYKDDYAAANVPMLPVKTNARSSAWWILLHAAGTSIAALALAAHPALGWVYLLPAGILSFILILGCIRLVQNPERGQAMKVFLASNIFLAAVLLSIILVATGQQLFFS